jgi:SAM-dependent methyltransferase
MTSFLSANTDKYDRWAFELIHLFNVLSGLRTANVGFAPVDRDISDDPAFALEARQIQLYAEILRCLPFTAEQWLSIGLLEIGAAGGAGLRYIKKRYNPRQATGVDFSRIAVWQARRAGLDVRQAAFNRLPFPDGSFECVLCVEVGEGAHQQLALREFRRVLKPEGRLLIAIIMHESRGDLIKYFDGLAQGAGLDLENLTDLGEGARRSIMSKSDRPPVILHLLPTKQRRAVIEDLIFPGSHHFEEWKSGAFHFPVAVFRRPR